MLRLSSAALFATVLLATGCEKDNPNFCVDGECGVDAGIDAVTGCREDPGACPAGQECLQSDDRCVDCLDGTGHESAGCAVTEPVCAADHSCRACTADSECDGDLCEAGRCVAAADIIYLSSAATDNAMCTQAMKCKTLDHAMSLVTTTRKHVHMAQGEYLTSDPVTVDGKAVIVHGHGSTLDRDDNNEIVIVTGGATAELRDIVIIDADGGSGQGIKCDGESTLVLRRAMISGAAQNAVSATACSLDIRDSRLTENGRTGILGTSGDTLTLVNNVIQGNLDGGVAFSGVRFIVVGNYVVANGDALSPPVGGLDLAATMSGSRLEHNTIAGNIAAASVVGGVRCGAVGLTSKNNIVWDNVGLANMQHLGCNPEFSCLQGAAVTGTGNVNTDPAFTRTGIGAEMFHLGTNSPLKGAADPATVVDELNRLDVDGDGRPLPAGGPADIGADEIP